MAGATVTTLEPGHAGSRRAGAPQGIAIGLIAFLPALVVLALPPALPSMIAAFRGTPHAPDILSWLIGVPGLAIAVAASFGGWAVDRYGRRVSLIASLLLYIVAGMTPTFFPNLIWIFISRIGIGVSEAIMLVASSAMLADYFNLAERRVWLTVQGIVVAILVPISVIASAALASQGWQNVFLIYGSAIPILGLIWLFCYEPVAVSASGGEAAAEQPVGRFPWAVALRAGVITLSAAILAFVFVIHSGLALRVVGVQSTERLGTLLGIMSLGSPLGAVLFNIVSRRTTIEWTLASMLVLMAVSLLGVGWSTSTTMMVAFGFVQQAGAGMAIPSLAYWTSHLFPAAQRGRGFGLFTSTFFLGQFLCAPLISLFQSWTGGILSAMIVLGVAGIAAAAMTLFIAPRPLEE